MRGNDLGGDRGFAMQRINNLNHLAQALAAAAHQGDGQVGFQGRAPGGGGDIAIVIGGGLRRTQQLGDDVLAHAYIREDHVLDDDLPIWVPVPPIAEVQLALEEAVARKTGLRGHEMKVSMRTGTVATTDNRNWELRHSELSRRFSQSRAIAVDMESATIAANGFRLRVPYGTLLCVSDKPLHGELKLRGMANAFYNERVSQHLKIGIEAIELLRAEGVDQLHSRKLRSFREPAFR